ncbi:MAG: hypothetical protein HY875_11235 [Chloroflexi bacterium]|nr:hypothetical protein [Chloroflexota bacterium]
MLGRLPQQDPFDEGEIRARVERIHEDPHLRGPGKSILAAAGVALLVVWAAWWAWPLIT